MWGLQDWTANWRYERIKAKPGLKGMYEPVQGKIFL
jgi:hypothetical protein